MYSIIISLLLGAGFAAVFGATDISNWGWAVALGVIAAMASYILFSLAFRRSLVRRMGKIQRIIAEGTQNIQKRMQLIQSRPVGNPKQIMKEFEKYQNAMLQQAFDAVSEIQPLVGWVPLIPRQMATMRMQFAYQMKDYDKVDAYMPKCLMMEPMHIAMKLAQMRRRGKSVEEIRKEFNKYVVRLKYNKSALIYSLMAWILIKEKRDDEANELMVEACRKNENDILKANRDALANKKVQMFSNAGLGDEWYALYLEEPKMNVRRQAPSRHGRPF